MKRPLRTAGLFRQDDHTLASAFLAIEERMNLARTSIIAAEMLFVDAWACGPQFLPEAKKAALGLSGNYHLLVVTDDQFQAVEHLIGRAREDVDALLSAYYEWLELPVQSTV
ncbi:hypothetical protein [Methylobacterium sp. Leaf91]|uniref:hypothetical protein n=1 Tax=Methylobacterium sp. Leaf91 TaxID=1736247 RepID=UPI0006F6C0A3|nr:hypothetical protein [Methylobacterium sp. Leaf91]KQO93337.1 hypothetical protein ASF32_03685 [Methylobacterium sp. Leaf91]